MRKLTAITLAILLVGASACDTPTDRSRGTAGLGPQSLLIPIPGNKKNYLSTYLLAFTNNGTVGRVDVKVSLALYNASSRKSAKIAVDPNLAQRAAAAVISGTDAASVTELAMIAARATYCRTGPIRPNNGNVRYRDPAAIAAILAESSRLNRDAVPPGLKGEPVPAARYRTDGYGPWEVSLLCESPNPYLAQGKG